MKVWVTHSDGTREHLRAVDLNDHLYDLEGKGPYRFILGPQWILYYPDLEHGERVAICDPVLTLLGVMKLHEGCWYVSLGAE